MARPKLTDEERAIKIAEKEQKINAQKRNMKIL